MRLTRPAPPTITDRALDPAQAAAVAHRGSLLRVLGAPGTGKTTVALEIVLDRVRSGELPADACLVLTSGRQAADRVRSHITTAIGGTSTSPLARTLPSLGFGILAAAAAARGEPAPRLLSGPEQDVVLGELLRGHQDEDTGPVWPPRSASAVGTRGFRQELRDLLMRAVELDLGPRELADLGRQGDRPEWVAAAAVLAEYDEVTALASPGAVDPAWLLGAAATTLADDEQLAADLAQTLRLVIVDDAQELTHPGLRLLSALTRRISGLQMVLIGDPDAATQTFRGADPALLAHRWLELGEGPTHVLRTDHRSDSAVRAAARAVTGHIGVVGGTAHRAPEGSERAGVVEVHQVRTVAEEAQLAADTVRRAHLLQGVPWSRMAVIVRGRARTATLRRVLSASGVPVGVAAADLPLRDEPAVRPLLDVLGHVTSADPDQPLDPGLALDLLVSPLGGADAVVVRRLRRALRQDELAVGGGRTSDELLVAAIDSPAMVLEVDVDARPLLRIARVVATGREAARVGGSAEDVLWAIWRAAGVAETWQQLALAGGPAGQRADRDLDAVLALFAATERFVDRLPQAPPRAFLEHIQEQEVPGDTLAPRSQDREVVELLTPQVSAGRGWDLVVIAGVQEGVWPDLRLRGSLLGSADLADVVTGRRPLSGDPGDPDERRRLRRAAIASVRHDELRLFHVALTRARHRVLVTAVRSEDEQPSPLLEVVDPLPDDTETRPFTTVERPLTLAALVGRLRREAVGGQEVIRARAFAGLALLGRAGVPGADPAQWWVLTPLSDDRPRRGPDSRVSVSPSALQGYVDCELRWFLTASEGQGPPIGSAAFGTLVHEIAASHEGAALPELSAALDAQWARLGLRPGWTTDNQRALGEQMMTRLAAWFAQAEAHGWRRVGAEVSVRAHLGRIVLRGTLDRVDLDQDGGLRVADYKTGSTKPTKDEIEHHPQLGAYQVALGRAADPGDVAPELRDHLDRPVHGAALIQLGKSQTSLTPGVQTQPALDRDEDPLWAEQLITQIGEGMAGATFLAKPDARRCSRCPVRTSCPVQPEGQAI